MLASSAQSWSGASQELDRAYSDVTSSNASAFDRFYDKWGGILRSGESGSSHFLESYATFRLEHDDDNLKFAKKFQHTMNRLANEMAIKSRY